MPEFGRGDISTRRTSFCNSWSSMGKFWYRASTGLRSKLRVFEALINSTIMSGATAAVFTQTDLERMERARTTLLRKLAKHHNYVRPKNSEQLLSFPKITDDLPFHPQWGKKWNRPQTG